jgi:hypothetical protein
MGEHPNCDPCSVGMLAIADVLNNTQHAGSSALLQKNPAARLDPSVARNTGSQLYFVFAVI